MPYTSNPYAPKARKLATNLVKKGTSKAQVARLYGVHRATIGKWLKKASKHSLEQIQTKSSAPHHHPNQISSYLEDRVIVLRKKSKRCAVIIHHQLLKAGLAISLSTVKRIFRRHHLTRKGKRAQMTHTRFKRPASTHPGALIEMDTVHFVTNAYRRFYIYTVIDTFTRMAYAEFQPTISPMVSCGVVTRALKKFPFPVEVIQTDRGHEFSLSLEVALQARHIRLRHSRVRKPNDNAHIERFNRTIQEECFNGVFPKQKGIEKRIQHYMNYYNKDRLHLGIQCKTPEEMLPRC